MDSVPYQAPAATIDWTSALDTHSSWIRKVVNARVVTSQDVDDVVQEISAAVLKPGKRPADPDKVAPWLYGVAVRQASQFLRKRGQQERLIDHYVDKAPLREAPENPRDWVMRRELRQSVRECLTHLSTEEREILLLKYTEELTYAQLADLLGLTVKAVEHRLLKARTSLRLHLQHHD